MSPGLASRLGVLLLVGLGVVSIFTAVVLAAAGPRATAGCPAAGWTGYVPLVQPLSAARGYELDGTFWIQDCRPIPTGP